MMYRTREAANYVGLKKCTLEAWRVRGEGPAFLKLGKAVRYRKEDLDAFINANVRTSTAEKHSLCLKEGGK